MVIILRTAVRALWMVPLACLLIAAVSVAWFYISCPVYTFTEPRAFSGEHLHNPYQNITGGQWLKGNFQVQSRAWGGLTDGRKNTNEAIEAVYRMLGYDIIVTSDYQKINRYGKDSAWYIPTYEHGYGVYKTHQVCIGSRRVLWRDYPFFPGLSNKQHVIERLLPDNEIVALAHPDLRDGYLPRELNYLRGYHLIEALNRARESIPHWDSALSAGYPAFILANDDAHDISQPEEVGRYATFIYSPENRAADIIRALKEGKAYGARIYMPAGETFDEKARKAGNLPSLISCRLNADTLIVEVSDTATEIRFYGQGGAILNINRNQTRGQYIIRDKDTYIRTEIQFRDRTVFFLNPVYRYSGPGPEVPPLPRIDPRATRQHRMLWGTLSLMAAGLIVYYLIRRKRKYPNGHKP